MSLAALRPHLRSIRIPRANDKVYKEECLLCFDNPDSPTGLYVCMSHFWGFSRDHVQEYSRRTSRTAFLHIKRTRIEIEKDETEMAPPTKLAIGLEGGFDPDCKRYEYSEQYAIVLMPDFYEISLPCPDLPEIVQISVTTILAAESVMMMDDINSLDGTWDGMRREVTRHANNLLQANNGVKIPPKGWKCDRCGLEENLWLNLTDGTIHCGRRYFDGSGGNNHALEHFKVTGYPLVVKLGTITTNEADVYSYDEDSMVIDPNLASHLAHFGINVTMMQKTEKSMIELEIAMNQRIGEWAIIQESGSPLVPLFGPGYTGLDNLGNSCYLNSVMQVLFSIPDFQNKYYSKYNEIILDATSDPNAHFNMQMAKLGHGLLSGRYSKLEEGKDIHEQEQLGVRPHTFKCLVGKGHPEFSTKRQQDAQEFFLHLMTMIERQSREQENPVEALKLQVEEKIQCVTSRKVKYDKRADYLLSLPIPFEAAINKEEVAAFEKLKAEKVAKGDRVTPEETVRPKIPLEACLESFTAAEEIQDFFSTALDAKSNALKTTKIHTFPDYLMLHMKKFSISDDWIPKKLDVSIIVPDILDLAALRGQGLQPGEEELPESLPKSDFKYDASLMNQISDMGFPVEACKRALYFTQNGDMHQIMNWLTEHITDPDYNTPFDPSRSKVSFVPDDKLIATIVSMGFTSAQASKALLETDNNLERAVDYIFSHVEELEEPVPMDCVSFLPKYRDGPEQYELVAFISHMGASSVAGHYVCHIKKEGRWVIFNDNKVAQSEQPPKEFAYMYLYRRIPAAS